MTFFVFHGEWNQADVNEITILKASKLALDRLTISFVYLQVWFQNRRSRWRRRELKNKHQQTQDAASASPPAPVFPPFPRLPDTSDVMEYSRAFQTQRRDRLGAEMQSQWQFKLFCDWSVNQTAWFCHGNGVLEYTVSVLQSAAVDDKIPATKQDKPSFLGWMCSNRYFSEWIFKGRINRQ